MLENRSKFPTEYMLMERWNHDTPMCWQTNGPHLRVINQASYKYTFEIEANPDDIVNEWKTFTQRSPNIIHNNCGDGAQWFLQRFADIPAPSPLSGPLTLNHFALGIFLPSFFPVGVTLPGRIMDNAKFHLETRAYAYVLPYQYSTFALKICVAVTLLASISSFIGLVAAAAYLGSNALAATCTVTGAMSTWGLFKSVNTLAAVNLSKELNRVSEEKREASSTVSSDFSALFGATH